MSEKHSNRRGIAITGDTHAELLGLEKAFRGKANRYPLENRGDDTLVATLLGWHLRQFPQDLNPHTKSVWAEFTTRVEIAAHSDEFSDPELRALRAAAKGAPSVNRNVLTLEGICETTLAEITARVENVRSALETLKGDRLPHKENSARSLRLLLASMPDELIIDLSTMFYLHLSNYKESASEYPSDVRDEVEFRAITHPRRRVVKPIQKLSPRDRLAFTSRRRIDYLDPFWTTDRILRAKELGL